jgi:hypothetical protein
MPGVGMGLVKGLLPTAETADPETTSEGLDPLTRGERRSFVTVRCMEAE